MKAFSLFLICLLAVLLPAFARVSMDVTPREFTTDETATLTLRIQGGAPGTPSLTLPDGLEIIGTSRNEVIINRDRETSYAFTFRAREPGDYLIGPFTLTLEGRRHVVDGIPVSVTAAQVVRVSDELQVRIEASSSRALVQQALSLTVTFYSLHPIENIELAEFDTQGLDLSDWDGRQLPDRVIDGTRYRVARFTATATPLTPGTYSLAPTFIVQLLEPDEDLSRSRLGMFTRSVRRRNVRIQPDPVTFEAASPPAENRPADFSGALGTFSFKATASPLTLQVGEPITLRTEINGTGNLRTLLPPSLEESGDFRVFAPRLVEEDVAPDGLSGRKVLEQVLIPKHAEVSQIPEIRFTYFDPERWEYVTRTAGPFDLDVSPSATGITAPFATGAGSLRLNSGPTLLGQDLVYLKTDPGTLRPLHGMSPVPFTLWSSLPLALWGLAGLLHTRQLRLRQDPALARKRQAPRQLRKHLAAIHAAPSAGIHEAIWVCLTDYLAARFSIPPGEIQPDTLPAHLPATLRDETLATLLDWLHRCERARFAGAAHTDAPALAREFESFILTLDKEAV